MKHCFTPFILFMAGMALFTATGTAQQARPFQCSTPPDTMTTHLPGIQGGGNVCNINSINFAPYDSLPPVPIKQVRLVFHILQRTNGSGNLDLTDPAQKAFFNAIIDTMNYIYGHLQKPQVLPGGRLTAPYIADSRIQFQIERIITHRNTADFNAYQKADSLDHTDLVYIDRTRGTMDQMAIIYIKNTPPIGHDSLLTYEHLSDIEKNNSINLFLYAGIGRVGGEAAAIPTKAWIKLAGWDSAYRNQVKFPPNSVSSNLAHELGHALGLDHTFKEDPGWQAQCLDCDTSQANSNNIMSYGAERSFSACQLGIMHFYLLGLSGAATGVIDCVVNCGDNFGPITMKPDTATGNKCFVATAGTKYLTDLVVDSLETLQIVGEGKLLMPANRSITINPGGKLLINKGSIGGFCGDGDFWTNATINVKRNGALIIKTTISNPAKDSARISMEGGSINIDPGGLLNINDACVITLTNGALLNCQGTAHLSGNVRLVLNNATANFSGPWTDHVNGTDSLTGFIVENQDTNNVSNLLIVSDGQPNTVRLNSNAKLTVKGLLNFRLQNAVTLQYNKGAQIVLNNPGSVFYMNGKAIAIGADAEYKFSGQGYMVFEGYNAPIAVTAANNNGIFSILGAGKTRKMAEIRTYPLTMPANLKTFNLNNGDLYFAGPSALAIPGPITLISLAHARVFGDPEPVSLSTGIELYGQANTIVNDIDFLNGLYCLQTIPGSIGSATLKVQNCTFDYNIITAFPKNGVADNALLFAQNGAVTLNNCTFNRAGIGFWGDMMSMTSNVDTCMFGNIITNNNNTGIRYTGRPGSRLNVSLTSISNSATGILTDGATLSPTCSEINNNVEGLRLTNFSTLRMGLHNGISSRVHLNSIETGIHVNSSLTLDLNGGENTLYGGTYDIYGTLSTPCLGNTAPPLMANANNWGANKMGPNTTNVNLTAVANGICNGAAVTVLDAAPINPIDCGLPLSNFCQTHPTLCNHCIGCGIINTPDFLLKTLDQAVSIVGLRLPDPLANQLQTVSMYYQILTYPIIAATPDVQKLLNDAYQGMQEALALAYQGKQLIAGINATVFPAEVQMVLTVQNNLINAAGNLLFPNYQQRFYTSMDKVQTYRIAGARNMALNLLNEIKSFAKPGDDASLVAHWLCSIDIENKMLNGTIPKEQVFAMLHACPPVTYTLPVLSSHRNGRTGTADNNTIAVPSLDNTAESVMVIPNPNAGVFSILTNIGDVKTFSVKIFDITGRQVWEQNNIPANTVTIDLSALAKGMYYVKSNVNDKLFNNKVLLQ